EVIKFDGSNISNFIISEDSSKIIFNCLVCELIKNNQEYRINGCNCICGLIIFNLDKLEFENYYPHIISPVYLNPLYISDDRKKLFLSNNTFFSTNNGCKFSLVDILRNFGQDIDGFTLKEIKNDRALLTSFKNIKKSSIDKILIFNLEKNIIEEEIDDLSNSYYKTIYFDENFIIRFDNNSIEIFDINLKKDFSITSNNEFFYINLYFLEIYQYLFIHKIKNNRKFISVFDIKKSLFITDDILIENNINSFNIKLNKDINVKLNERDIINIYINNTKCNFIKIKLENHELKLKKRDEILKIDSSFSTKFKDKYDYNFKYIKRNNTLIIQEHYFLDKYKTINIYAPINSKIQDNYKNFYYWRHISELSNINMSLVDICISKDAKTLVLCTEDYGYSFIDLDTYKEIGVFYPLADIDCNDFVWIKYDTNREIDKIHTNRLDIISFESEDQTLYTLNNLKSVLNLPYSFLIKLKVCLFRSEKNPKILYP
ncbi:MAG: hypothetical protein ACK4IX_10530, partial [Candidatus Sericytochromatia bacterium]